MNDEEHFYRCGWSAALAAAREAVAALDIGRDVRFSVDVQADALAAIDALRFRKSRYSAVSGESR